MMNDPVVWTIAILVATSIVSLFFNFLQRGCINQLNEDLKRKDLQADRLLENNQKLQKLVGKDSLTGLNNREYMNNIIEREIRRAGRMQTKLSLIMIDFDHFKKINDELGHASGDAALRELAQFILEITRDTDVAFRYGGEEFLILLPNTSAEEARVYAERLRHQVGYHIFKCINGNDFRCTISAGVAEFPGKGEIAAFINEADQALYQSKEAGRNQVTVAA